jgi:hypothetical protein
MAIRAGHSFNQFEFDALLGNTDLPVGAAQIVYSTISADATSTAAHTTSAGGASALGAQIMSEVQQSWVRLDYNEFAGGDGVDRQEDVVVVHTFHPIKHHLQRLYDGDISGGLPPAIRRTQQFYFYKHGSGSSVGSMSMHGVGESGRREQCDLIGESMDEGVQESDSVQVPIILGVNATYKRELYVQVSGGDDVQEVARRFCLEHSIALEMQQLVADLINKASGHSSESPHETIGEWLGRQQCKAGADEAHAAGGELFMLLDHANDNIVPTQTGPNGERLGGPTIHLAVSAKTSLSADVQVCLGDQSGHICTPLNNDLMHRAELHLADLSTRTLDSNGIVTSNSSKEVTGASTKPNKYAVTSGVIIGWAPGSLLRGPGNRVVLRVLELGGFPVGPHRLFFWLMEGAESGGEGARNVSDAIGFRFRVRSPTPGGLNQKHVHASS